MKRRFKRYSFALLAMAAFLAGLPQASARERPVAIGGSGGCNGEMDAGKGVVEMKEEGYQ